ncbi:hypothetical protein KUTeg_015310 [Tegillarca granosa]|uniref:G-protein coupled receptors family 1 profile domain-containing protein n=1 Tax=Tegillarca granosa TaxID=220873 RepID=A0ABQ9ETD8_TEGGR|nr:hypothetical protein KUTeg_015310 [Tegillarca granosa]
MTSTIEPGFDDITGIGSFSLTTESNLNYTGWDGNDTINDSNTTAAGNPLFDYAEYAVALFINRYYLIFICCIGIPGNIAALITLAKMRPLSSSLLYMVVLAVVDTVALVIKILYLQLTTKDVKLGDIGCKFIFFIGNFSMQYSSWILVAMTVERFIAIWFPLKVSKWCTRQRAILVMVLEAILLMGLNLHYFWTFHETTHDLYVYDCSTYSEYQYFHSDIWYYLDGLAYSILPFVILIMCNFMIIFGIKRSGRKQQVLTNKMDKFQSADKAKQQNQITIMLVTISIVFVVFTMPNCLFFIIKGKINYLATPHSHAIWILWMQVVFFLSDANHAINFYLYFLSGQKFRKKFKSIICCRKSPRRIRFNTTISNINSVYRKQSSYTSDNYGYNRSQTSINEISSSPDTAFHKTFETSFSKNGMACKNGHAKRFNDENLYM